MEYEKYYEKFLNENPYPRKLKSLEVIQGSFSTCLGQSGNTLINFSSSDYLGLAKNPALIKTSHEYATRYGIGSGASRLVSGNLHIFTELEVELAKALRQPAALILGSGYQTNVSVLDALLDKKVLGDEAYVFADKLCHVSMLMGVKHNARLSRFRHNDLDHLETLLKKYSAVAKPKFILVESVYSMDGDKADLEKLIGLAEKYHAFLYVDDAHAVGVYGATGWGMSEELADRIPMVMGTFSKALGSYGSYIGCSEMMKEYLINKCKGLIYSTAISPAMLGAIRATIDVVPQLYKERQKVQEHANRLRSALQQLGLTYGKSNTHIVPWIIGDAKTTLKVASQLESRGILGTAIQPPSVPAGTSRIRFCMSAVHTQQEIEHLISAITKVAIEA